MTTEPQEPRCRLLIEELIEASSLGTPEAKELRDSIPRDDPGLLRVMAAVRAASPSPGSAQEPADPPQWEQEAKDALHDEISYVRGYDFNRAWAAMMPILRAGIEAELLRDACGCGMPGAGILHPASDHRGQS